MEQRRQLEPGVDPWIVKATEMLFCDGDAQPREKMT